MEDEDNRQNHRLEIIEKNQQNMQDIVESVHMLARDMADMLSEQKDQGKRLDALEAAPGKRWNRVAEKAMDTAVGLIAGGIIAALVAACLPYIR